MSYIEDGGGRERPQAARVVDGGVKVTTGNVRKMLHGNHTTDTGATVMRENNCEPGGAFDLRGNKSGECRRRAPDVAVATAKGRDGGKR